MAPTLISKPTGGRRVAPNLADYADACADFSWEKARAELVHPPRGGINIAYEAIDRHALGGRADHIALRWLDADLEAHDFSYGDLYRLTNRFANVLRDLGIGRGDTVFALIERVPALYIAALGALKNGSVFCPLLAASGRESVQARMAMGRAQVLVTTPDLYRRKVAPLRGRLPDLKHVLLVGEMAPPPAGDAGLHGFDGLLGAVSDSFEIAPTAPEQAALLHFAGAVAGRPRGLLHVHAAVVAHRVAGKCALDLQVDDIFWCTLDPASVAGAAYGLVAPFALGVTVVVDREEFEPERCYAILQRHGISVCYMAADSARLLMQQGAGLARQYVRPALRFIACGGGALAAETVCWGEEALGLPFHDSWWQPETGGIAVANYPALPIKPGSMGKPLPGIEAAIVRRRDDGSLEFVGADMAGEFALRAGWPSMFRGYLYADTRYCNRFVGEWYLSGDIAKCDSDGYFWWVGRVDDTAGATGA